MGEVADDILTGVVCDQCGQFFLDDEVPEHPRTCNECDPEHGVSLDPNYRSEPD